MVVDLDTDSSTLQVDISDALSEKEKVKFTIHTKTTMDQFAKLEFSVTRLHEDFLWLHDVIQENTDYAGFIIPPRPPSPNFDSSREKLQRLGELPSTRDAIIDVAAMHMDNIRDAFVTLFAAFKDLNENINKYITYEKRNAAIKAGEKAIANTNVIEEEIRDKVADDQEDPNAPPVE